MKMTEPKAVKAIDMIENTLQNNIKFVNYSHRTIKDMGDLVINMMTATHEALSEREAEIDRLRREKDETLQRVQVLEQLVQDLKETVAEYEAFDEEFDDNDKMQGPSDDLMIAALNGVDLLPQKRKIIES